MPSIPKAFNFLSEGLIGTTVKKSLKNPGKALPLWALGGMFGKELIVDPIVEAITDDPYKRMVQDSRARNAERKHLLGARMQYEDLERRMAKASMRLAALDPHLYNEVMAGRSLPKDAVVFGGQPRTDLMEELAASMAGGSFEEPMSAQDELMSELGVQ